MASFNLRTLSLALLVLVCTGCSQNRKQAYTSKTYYERVDRWILSDKYVEIVVAVPIEDRVEPAFLVERVLFQKVDGRFEEIAVVVVNKDVYEAAEKRRQGLLDNVFNFFRFMAMLGIGSCVLGALVFVLKFKFPAIPDIWDEMLLYGGLLACVGLFGAWYHEQLVYVGAGGGAALLVVVGYSVWKQYRKEKALKVSGQAVQDLVTTVEVFKVEAASSWDTVKTKLTQLPTTEDLVTELKPVIKKKLGIA